MRVTIRGLTQSTISFNTLGIILRGAVEARSIELKNDAQIREVNAICNAGLITVVKDEPAVAINPVIIQKPSAPAPVVQAPNIVTEHIEDKPKKSKGGRPKGSKNKVKGVEPVKKATKTIKKLAPSFSKPSADPDDIESKVVVMTSGGPMDGHMIKSATGDMPDCDATQASLQAMKDIEAEEKADREAEEVIEDQSKLDASEQTGGQAVIATGDRSATKISMKNSILPAAEAIRKAEKFIPLDQTEDKSEDAFIDKDDGDDDFLEV